MFGLSPIPLYTIVALAALNIALGFGWWVTGVRLDSAEAQVATCEATHDAFVRQVEAQGQIADEKRRSIENHNRRIADETEKGWAAALAVVRRDADQRVRLAASRDSSGGGLSKASPSTYGITVPAKGALPDTERVIADCSEDVLKLVWLQHWIKETHDGQE